MTVVVALLSSFAILILILSIFDFNGISLMYAEEQTNLTNMTIANTSGVVPPVANVANITSPNSSTGSNVSESMLQILNKTNSTQASEGNVEFTSGSPAANKAAGGSPAANKAAGGSPKAADTKDTTELKDAILKIVMKVENNCQPKDLCSDINALDMFRTEVYILEKGTDEVIDTISASEDGLSHVVFSFDTNESTRYIVNETRKNFALLPWNIQKTSYSECNSTIAPGQTKICTITISVEQKDFNLGNLYVNTSITNNCMPNYLCSNLHANTLFSDYIFTLVGNTYEQELEIPASETGWTIRFFPSASEGIVQYDVKQSIMENEDFSYKPSIVTYSSGCHGDIKGGDKKYCTISNTYTEGNLSQANLNITTRIQDECTYGGPCTNMRMDELFTNHVSTFRNNEYEDGFEVPASERGWVAKFVPSNHDGIVQYDVKQSIDDDDGYSRGSPGPWDVSYSLDCHGILKAGENKLCIITNRPINNDIKGP